jgi:hypothetical protein
MFCFSCATFSRRVALEAEMELQYRVALLIIDKEALMGGTGNA